MSIYDLYETDTSLEEEGVWVEIGGGVNVKVAALGNKNHQKAMEKMFAPYKAQRRNGSLDAEIEEDIHTKAIAKAVLVDWEGVTDREGDILPYNFENAYKILADESLKRFKGNILFLAKEAETFKKQEQEEAVKNSSKSSDGTSNTGTKSKKSEKE